MSSNTKIITNFNQKQLKTKASAVFKGPENANHLFDIVKYLENCVTNNQPVAPCLLTLETIFTKLLQQRKMVIELTPTKATGKPPDNPQRDFFRSLYHETLRLLFLCFNLNEHNDSVQALVTTMKLMASEGNYPIEASTETQQSFPVHRLRSVLTKLLSSDRSNRHLINRFKEYASYVDILSYSWKILPSLTQKGTQISDYFMENYLDLVSSLPLVDNRRKEKSMLLCPTENFQFDYQTLRKNLNKSWSCTANWELNHNTHKHLLTVLIEHVLLNLQRPVLQIDYLMDSLNAGGQIALLALQGIFTLCQQSCFTYPNIYVKLYSMFEPEIFHTKYKARLFYLADIFLSSTHLPESVVAAFAKRLARLSLVAPPQDIVIIIYFVENLLLRHPELKRLLQPIGQVSNDPYIADERDPNKSNAIESSLWEIVLQQRHTIPTVEQLAADLIFYRLPSTEWDLSNYLEIDENDEFDQEILKHTKLGLNFERSMGIPKKDIWLFWNL